MGNVENNLLYRIDRTVAHLVSKGYSEDQGVVKKLRVLSKNIEGGMIPGIADFNLIDFYEPRAILPKCQHISPMGLCKVGIMEYCRHRAEWEKGKNTCQKYVERDD